MSNCTVSLRQLPLRFLQTPPIRCFSTSPPALARPAISALKHKHARIPPYPYGISYWYKQSNFGLYGNSKPQSGNTVSSRTEIKNRRKWHPNIQSHRLYSEALGRFIRVKVLARVLRTIDKVGGLDEYLLGEKSSRVRELGMGGWALRWRVMRTEWYRGRRERERRSMGLLGEEADGADGGLEREDGDILMYEGGVGSEEEATTREGEIDRVLQRVDVEAERGVDSGVELGYTEEGGKDMPRAVV